MDTAAAGTTVTYATPTVTDNEDPSPDISCTPASGSIFTVGQTRVTCTATDAQGNVATKTFTRHRARPAPVGATVPATLSLTLGAPATFGAFTPGVARTYNASTTANVISSAGNAVLSVADPSAQNTGHLVNGSFALPQPLGGLGTVKTYTGPVSNDSVTVPFSQAIGAADALRTGTYSQDAHVHAVRRPVGDVNATAAGSRPPRSLAYGRSNPGHAVECASYRRSNARGDPRRTSVPRVPHVEGCGGMAISRGGNQSAYEPAARRLVVLGCVLGAAWAAPAAAAAPVLDLERSTVRRRSR